MKYRKQLAAYVGIDVEKEKPLFTVHGTGNWHMVIRNSRLEVIFMGNEKICDVTLIMKEKKRSIQKPREGGEINITKDTCKIHNKSDFILTCDYLYRYVYSLNNFFPLEVIMLP